MKKLTEKEKDKLMIVIMTWGLVITVLLPTILNNTNKDIVKEVTKERYSKEDYFYKKSKFKSDDTIKESEEKEEGTIKEKRNNKLSYSHNPNKKRIKVIATVYNPTKSQCDNSPLITADNSKINLKKLKRKEIKWIAVSRDLLESGKLSYGDKVKIKSKKNSKINGVYEIHDTMHKRWKNRIDLLSPFEESVGKWEDVYLELISQD